MHLIYKYKGECGDGAYKGLKIEVQIRSRRQHAWATALETIDAFAGQGLKVGAGQAQWERFFILVSAFMAVIEKKPIPPGIQMGTEMYEEYVSLCHSLNVPNVFLGISTGFQAIGKLSQTSQIFILQLDSEKKATRTLAFDTNKEAEKTLLDLEKENSGNPHIQTVMASANSVNALKKAYPSYFADTNLFIGFVDGIKNLKKNIETVKPDAPEEK